MERIDLLKEETSPTLHDCIVSRASLENGILTLEFSNNGLTKELAAQGRGKLCLSVILDERFLDEPFLPSVMQVDHKKLFTRSAVTYSTLKEWVQMLDERDYKLRISTFIFRGPECFLHVKPIKAGEEQVEKDFYISLLASTLIYQWDDGN